MGVPESYVRQSIDFFMGINWLFCVFQVGTEV